MTDPSTAQQIAGLARRTIEAFLRDGIVIEPPEYLIPMLMRRAGAFVSLHRRGQLRGCIGTIEPSQPSLAEEIIANAISAATRDPRFSPLQLDELDDLDVSVDVLESPESVTSMDDLDPSEYGVIVEAGTRRGLLLPDLEGVDTAEQQVRIALRKAWISAGEPHKLFRFRVTRYH